MHPRGKERFAEADLGRRWQANLHHNSLVSSVRKGLTAPVDDEQNTDPPPTPNELISPLDFLKSVYGKACLIAHIHSSYIHSESESPFLFWPLPTHRSRS